jgi:hypothetical protein
MRMPLSAGLAMIKDFLILLHLLLLDWCLLFVLMLFVLINKGKEGVVQVSRVIFFINIQGGLPASDEDGPLQQYRS